jgi:small subunit ribosomal protein S6
MFTFAARLSGRELSLKLIYMNQYETVFILTPVLSETQMKEAVKEYEQYLKEKGAKIVNAENWGLRKLAYPIQKKSTGFYHLIEFTADPDLCAELELKYRRDERVIRFLTTRLDKHAIAYSIRRRNKAKEQKSVTA